MVIALCVVVSRVLVYCCCHLTLLGCSGGYDLSAVYVPQINGSTPLTADVLSTHTVAPQTVSAALRPDRGFIILGDFLGNFSGMCDFWKPSNL